MAGTVWRVIQAMFDEVIPTLPESGKGVKHLFERGGPSQGAGK
jgi:hypothetical protein